MWLATVGKGGAVLLLIGVGANVWRGEGVKEGCVYCKGGMCVIVWAEVWVLGHMWGGMFGGSGIYSHTNYLSSQTLVKSKVSWYSEC